MGFLSQHGRYGCLFQDIIFFSYFCFCHMSLKLFRDICGLMNDIIISHPLIEFSTNKYVNIFNIISLFRQKEVNIENNWRNTS